MATMPPLAPSVGSRSSASTRARTILIPALCSRSSACSTASTTAPSALSHTSLVGTSSFEENWRVYGVRKVWRQLGREGFDVARCTVARLMKGMGIQGIIRGKPHRTTIPDKKFPCPLDKVNRQFRAPAPNRLWVSDFTDVATWKGFVYVAFVIDAYARKIVGWRVSTSAQAGVVLDALEQAVHARRPAKAMGLVHHSDRGSQYLSIRYTEWLAEAGIEPSVGSVGDSYDNALAETITGCSRLRSYIVAAPGAAPRPWNMPPWNGSTGSTTDACSSQLATFRPRKPRPTSTQLWKLKPWPRNY